MILYFYQLCHLCNLRQLSTGNQTKAQNERTVSFHSQEQVIMDVIKMQMHGVKSLQMQL